MLIEKIENFFIALSESTYHRESFSKKSRSVKVAPPHRKSTIHYSLEFWAFFGLFLGTDKKFWAPLLFTEKQISCGGASLHKAGTSTIQKFE